MHARLLSGPMKALNLMTRNGDGVRLEVLDEGRSFRGAIVVVAIGGSSELDLAGQVLSLQVLDAVVELPDSDVRVSSGRVAILISD